MSTATRTTWPAEVRAALERVLAYPGTHPDRTRTVYVDAVRSGNGAVERLDDDVDALAELIDRGRAELNDPDSLTRATADGLAGAVYELVSMHVVRGAEEELPELLPQLMFSLTCPYLGLNAALAEHRRGL